jgi:hypothetical protein
MRVKNRIVGMLVLLDLATTVVWLVIMVGLFATYGTIETFEQAMDFAVERHWLFYTVSYVNAILLTLSSVSVYAGLYALLRPHYPEWATIGFAFVPVYGLIALLSYLSQIVVVPQLVELAASPQYEATATVLLKHLIQIWPESSLQQVDQFSYVILGIPSFLYGVMLYRLGGRTVRVAGGVLALGGPFTLLMAVGVVARQMQLVELPSMIGGVLSIVAFAFLGVGLLRGEPGTPERPMRGVRE